MNEAERKALVEELAEAMGLTFGPGDVPPGPDEVAACLPIIERLLAAADAPGLDELLDSVHPEATIDLGITLPGYQDKGRWGVTVFAPSGTTWESTREVNGLARSIEAFGSTRMDAIRNAVAQATTTQEGTEHEQDV